MLHLDLDAFFASVEQRDKPSLRGKPVVVGGIGARGVVATASYEARAFGVRSAMPAAEARRRCPHAAFLGGRFGAYREASGHVMRALRELSPLVEPLSLDEAFVDLRGASRTIDLSPKGLQSMVAELKADIAERTGGLTASVGVATSKFVAKVASELAKPDGLLVVEPGTEVALLRPMPVGVIPGVGPVTQERLGRLGVRTVADLQAASVTELVQVVGQAHGHALTDLAFARDDRAVEPERESKSISVEDTFENDLVDPSDLRVVLARDAAQVAARLRAARLFARTVTIKVRHARLHHAHPIPDPARGHGSRARSSATSRCRCSLASTPPVASGCSASGSPASPTCCRKICSPTLGGTPHRRATTRAWRTCRNRNDPRRDG